MPISGLLAGGTAGLSTIMLPRFEVNSTNAGLLSQMCAHRLVGRTSWSYSSKFLSQKPEAVKLNRAWSILVITLTRTALRKDYRQLFNCDRE